MLGVDNGGNTKTEIYNQGGLNMKCDSLTCPICRWGECVGDRNIAKELFWCEKTDDEIIEMEQKEVGDEM